MAAKKKAPAKPGSRAKFHPRDRAPAAKKNTPPSGAKHKAASGNADEALLQKYEHHTGMASKHRAHADLIEAKLKVQGKRIGHDYGDRPSGAASPSNKVPKRIIVPAEHDRY